MFREPGDEDGPGEPRDPGGDAGGSSDSGRITCFDCASAKDAADFLQVFNFSGLLQLVDK